jgi:hypothetical protein
LRGERGFDLSGAEVDGVEPGHWSPKQARFLLYTAIAMRRITATALVLLGLALALSAVEPQYQDAVLVSVEQKVNTRVLYYIVNTPITKDEPYYEVSLRLKGSLYLARYTPRHADDTLPEEWKAGLVVPARVEGRHLLVKSAGGTDWKFVITKRRALKAGEENPPPASGNR